MSMQTLALAFLAATAIGGLAWVFVYPSLSGERKAVAPRLGRTYRPAGAPGREDQRSRREQVEGSLKELDARRKKEKSVPLDHPPGPGRAGILDAPEILDHVRHFGAVGVRARLCDRRRPAGRRRDGIRHRPRPAALGPGLSQEAPREGVPEGASRRRRRHRARHQGRPAAVRIDQGGRSRCARAAEERVQRHHRNPDHRHAARRSLRAAVSSGCRCRRRTSSAS